MCSAGSAPLAEGVLREIKGADVSPHAGVWNISLVGTEMGWLQAVAAAAGAGS